MRSLSSFLVCACAALCLCASVVRAEDVTGQGNPIMTVSDNLNDTAYFPRQGPGVGSTVNMNGMTDGNIGTFNTTWTGDANGGWLYDGIGLQFPAGVSGVHRFEWVMQTFGDGGWYNTLDVALKVQVTTNAAFAGYPIITGTYHVGDGLWQTVASYNDYPLYVSASTPGPGVPAHGSTFVFEIDSTATIYGIRIIGDAGGWAGSDGTGFVGAQEIRVLTGDGTGRARPVSPAADVEGVAVAGLELVWAGAIDPNVVGHYVYVGTDPNGMLVSGPTPLPLATVSFAPALAKDTLYYWRVDEALDNGGVIKGYTASFRTELSLPIINSQPADTTAGAGRKGAFSVAATGPAGGALAYQWYYDADGADGGSVALADGAGYSGAAAADLTVLDAQPADDGYYFCVVDNGNAVRTRMARLFVGRAVAHWPLDGDPNDIVDGYRGTEFGGPVYEAGVLGQAMRFDGINDYIQLPEGFEDLSWGLTLSVWAKPTTNGAWARFVDFANGPANDNILFARADISNSIALGVYNGGAGRDAWSPAVLQNNVWQMLTATLDHLGNVVFYKNGQRIGTGVTHRPNVVWRRLNYIGKSNWTFDLPYAGSMDDVRLYNYPLTAQEVTDLYLMTPGVEYVCVAPPQLDLNGDCKVDLVELAALAAAWLECGRYPTCITEF